jgi:hypothetical protein
MSINLIDYCGAYERKGKGQARRRGRLGTQQRRAVTRRVSIPNHGRGEVALTCIRQYGDDQLAGVSGAAC